MHICFVQNDRNFFFYEIHEHLLFSFSVLGLKGIVLFAETKHKGKYIMLYNLG